MPTVETLYSPKPGKWWSARLAVGRDPLTRKYPQPQIRFKAPNRAVAERYARKTEDDCRQQREIDAGRTVTNRNAVRLPAHAAIVLAAGGLYVGVALDYPGVASASDWALFGSTVMPWWTTAALLWIASLLARRS